MNEKMCGPDLRFKEFDEPWREVMIGEICEVERSRNKRVNAVGDVKYPCYSVGSLRRVGWYEFEGERLVVGIGRLPKPHLCTYWVNGRFGVTGLGMCVLRLKGDGVNLKYVKYAIDAVDVRQFVMGSVVERLSVERLRRVGIMLPEIEEQNRIVETMDRFEKWCGDYENMVLDATRMRYALLRSMVTMSAGAEYPQIRFPEFCDKWRVMQLDELVHFYNGSMGKCEVMEKGGEYYIPLYSIVEKGEDEWEIVEKGYVKRDPKHELVPKGSVVWGCFSNRFNMNKLVDRDCKLNHGMMGAKADNAVCSDEYLYYLMEALDKNKFTDSIVMAKTNLAGVRVAIPCDKDEQLKIVKCMEAMDQYIDELNKKKGKMINFCKYLMGMMLKCNNERGEVRYA